MKRIDPFKSRLPDLDATRRSILERVVTQAPGAIRETQQPKGSLETPRTK